MSVLVEVARSAAPPVRKRHGRRRPLHGLARRLARGHRLAGLEPRRVRVEVLGHAAVGHVFERAGLVRVALAIVAEAPVPVLVLLAAAVADLAEVGERLVGDQELGVGIPAVELLRLADVLLAERRAVRLGGVLQRAAVADVGAHDDQRGTVLDLHRLTGGALERLDREVLAHVGHVPAVGLVTRADVLGHHHLDLAGQLDVVVVVEGDQPAEAPVAGERRRLGGHALLDVAVAGDHERVVIHDLLVGAVEARGHHALGERQAHRHRETLAERARGGLDPRRVLALRMPGGGRADLPEVLDVVEREGIAREVEHRVEQHRGVPRRQHEAVAIGPVRIGRVVAHHAREERVGERREGHRRSRVARVRLLDGVHGQRPDRVDAELFELGAAGAGCHSPSSFACCSRRPVCRISCAANSPAPTTPASAPPSASDTSARRHSAGSARFAASWIARSR